MKPRVWRGTQGKTDGTGRGQQVCLRPACPVAGRRGGLWGSGVKKGQVCQMHNQTDPSRMGAIAITGMA